MDRREDTVRNDPHVCEAGKILETARDHLLAAIVEGNITESRRLMEVFARAAFLKEETEDRVRIQLGLLTQEEAARRSAARVGQPQPGTAAPPMRARSQAVVPGAPRRFRARGTSGASRQASLRAVTDSGSASCR